jgi:hypothetical protein
MTHANNVAATILSQLTISTKMSCGVRKPVATPNSLICFVAGGNKTKLEIVLNDADLYDIRLVKITRDYDIRELAAVANVGVETLNETVYGMINK